MLDQATVDSIVSVLSSETGLSLAGEFYHDGARPNVVIRSNDFPKETGFKVSIEATWQRINATFTNELFSADFVKALSESSTEAKEMVSLFAQSIANEVDVTLAINGNSIPIGNPTIWPEIWESFSLTMVSKPYNLDADLFNSPDLEFYIQEWAGKIFGAIFPILPFIVDRAENGGEEIDGEIEGQKSEVVSSSPERNRRNRLACIAHYGFDCQICGLNFFEKYGSLGRGYIHVHHIAQLAKLKTARRINPITEMLPVCPNCHAMLHTQSPPLAPDDLKRIIDKT